MHKLMAALVAAQAQVAEAARDEEGATAIEWAIFALISLGIAGAVGVAIWLAINNRIPGIA